ncbi:RPM1-interacting protein 4-like isoform X1 [Zingiber officinale]|uniref:RPM1-interacting protein 4-like isoform X1 n=1 Tax=Zingiber officinale TaxID=94328 RepID=UPI001C4DD07C|nr:RPM1-interacting protein 4-like isoform X1 [Zingiber officinale]
MEPSNSKDESHQISGSPLRQGPVPHRVTTESPVQGQGYQLTSSEQKRGGRTGIGSEDKVERSPLHPHQVKASSRTDASSPFRGSSEGTSRMRTGGRGDETVKSSLPTAYSLVTKSKLYLLTYYYFEQPDKGSSVPKFGEWDESNPASADSFTGIFEKVREEKKHGSAKSPMISNDIIYVNDRDSGGSTSCCFWWCKK